MKKRIWAFLLAMCMFMSIMPTSVFADDAQADDVIYGIYKNSKWSELEDCDGSLYDEATGITLSKTATPTGKLNKYTIELKVETSVTQEDAPPAATVLVIDESISMRYCAGCGVDLNGYSPKHESGCSKPGNRMDAAKAAARSFLASYSSGAPSGRWLAIVGFGNSATLRQDWVDVTTEDGYNAANTAIGNLAATGYTNLDAGLVMANNQFSNSTVAGTTKDTRFVVALTDGVPNRTNSSTGGGGFGGGINGSESVATATATTAATLQAKSTVYTVCFGAADDECYSGGPTVGNYLKNYIASNTSYAYNAGDTKELNDAFKDITESIISGLALGGAEVTDPMTDFVASFDVSGVDSDQEGFTWTLSKPTNTWSEGNTTYYEYILTYTIEMDHTKATNKDTYYPTNGDTTLVIPPAEGAPASKVLQFPVPAVKVHQPEYTLTYVLDGGDITSAEGEYTEDGEVAFGTEIITPTVEKEGYTFAGWDPQAPATMPDADVTLTALWTVNTYNLTIHYVYADGTQAKPDYTATLDYSEAYSVTSPSITGYTASNDTVTGTMPAENVEVTVTYTAGKYSLTIYYKYADGTTAADTYTGSYDFGTAYNVPSPEIAGYTADQTLISDNMPANNVEATVTYTANSYTLTINYVYEDGTVAADTHTATVTYGAEYSVESPVIENYAADKTVVSGTMPANDVAETVTYKIIFVAEPAIKVEKIVKGDTTINVGDLAEYTITVTNIGNVPLYNVKVTDALTNDEWTIDELAAGSSKVFTASYVTTRADEGKTIKNTAVAEAPNGGPKDVDVNEQVKVEEDIYVPTAPAKPALSKADHLSYIIGYEDGTVRPLATITRAEVATIFFRLLTEESRADFWSQENPFPDVTADMWCNNAISTMYNAGIITGYPDGTFQPYAPVTRAEFAAIAARFSNEVSDGVSEFFDVPETYWAFEYIALAEDLGWVQGYAGYFRPLDNMTRAEVMTTVNRVLERSVRKQNMLEDMIYWPDNDPDEWYYEAVQEATNSHEYYRTKEKVYKLNFNYEAWTKLIENPDWAALERTWSDANSQR